jgi:hypothetical protein
MIRTILEFLIRLLLGAVLLPLVYSAFLLFCLVALCSDKQLLNWRWVLPKVGRLEPLGLRRPSVESSVTADPLAPGVTAGS